MLNWLIYNSVLPLMPVPLVYAGFFVLGARKRVVDIIRDGQLCFYCTSLAAVCLNDIFKSGDIHANAAAGIYIAVLIFCMILSTFTYGVAATVTPAGALDEVKLGFISGAAALTTTLVVIYARSSLGIAW